MKRLLFLTLPLLAFVVAFSPIDGFRVNGKIMDEKGNAISNAVVKVKGTTTTSTAATDGSYSIEASNKNGILVISAVGFATKEVEIRGKSTLNIVLTKSTTALDEVVVSGYSVRKKGRKDMLFSEPERRESPRAYKIMDSEADVPEQPRVGYYDKRRENNKEEFNTEGYDYINENRFLKVADNPLSTFSIDVDAASYSNVRRFLNQGKLPPAGAVRIEEMINYFHYDYPAPEDELPFSVNTEIADCPWNNDNKLVLVGLQGKKIPMEKLPASNIVFLIDVSGSMNDPHKLPLVQASMKMLVDQLRRQDRVAMVVYAGAAGLVLPSTGGNEKTKIKDAIDKLQAGGSTAGGAGIRLAYKIAKENFAREGNNRVILCTDGDFNIGVSSDDDMERLIEKERESGVYLTVLGYGMGNYKDSKMQKLADKGNGNHAYIDGISEAKKVLVNEFGGTLFTIAKDVKLQIEFNPAKVQGYRLIGYENRMLNKEDFNNDRKDAGDMGSGHSVTALYEVIPSGVNSDFLDSVDPLKYQSGKSTTGARSSQHNEIMNIKLRYKNPDAGVSRLIEHPVYDERLVIAKTSDNFRFAAAVAQFGMLLRNSAFKSNASYKSVLQLAKNAKGSDEEGYRSEFIRLVSSASSLAVNSNDDGEEDVSVIND